MTISDGNIPSAVPNQTNSAEIDTIHPGTGELEPDSALIQTGTLKDAVVKEIKTLINDYIEYTKNADL